MLLELNLPQLILHSFPLLVVLHSSGASISCGASGNSSLRSSLSIGSGRLSDTLLFDGPFDTIGSRRFSLDGSGSSFSFDARRRRRRVSEIDVHFVFRNDLELLQSVWK